MTSFELDITDEKSRAGAEFLARVVEEMQRALVTEKCSRKITQQAIADKIGTSRHVINREIQGLENVSARRIGEFFWAIGWEPCFEAKKPLQGENCDFLTPPQSKSAPVPPLMPKPDSGMFGSKDILNEILKKNQGAPVPAV
jgi:hypothetical protein